MKTMRALGTALATVLALAACTGGGGGPQPTGAGPAGTDAAAGGGDYPSQPVEFITAGDAGGGLDLFARSIEETLNGEGLLETSMTITNMGGGGGNPAMAVLQERRDDGHTLVGNSNRVYLNPITGTTDITLGEDFIPIAQLMTEYVVIAVQADSPYQSAEELFEALAADPQSVNFGVGTVPSNDQLNILRAADATGVDPAEVNIVAFASGGDLMTQLLGGQVHAISTTLSEALPQVEAGDVRLLAISSEERVEAVSDVPTWTEQGIDVVVNHWRGVFGPPEMPDEARQYWIDRFAQMVETETWQEVLERNQWSPIFNAGEDFQAILEEEAETTETLLREVGLVEG